MVQLNGWRNHCVSTLEVAHESNYRTNRILIPGHGYRTSLGQIIPFMSPLKPLASFRPISSSSSGCDAGRRALLLSLAYAMPCLVVWNWYHYVFWPAVMPPDSIDQWYQALTGSFHDAHPAFHTMLMAPFARLNLSPGIFVSIHIFAMAIIVGRAIAIMDEAGLTRYVTVPLVVFLAAVPANGASMVVLLKDATYCVAFVLLMVELLKAVISDGASLAGLRSLGLLAVSAILVALVRHNGPPVAFGTLLALPFVYRRHWKQLFGCLAVAVGAWWGVRGPLFSAIGVMPAASTLSLLPLLHQIDAHVYHGTPLTAPEQELVQRIHPLENGKWPYSAYSLDPLSFSPKLNGQSLHEEDDAIRALCVSLIARNPQTSLQHAKAVASLALCIQRPKDSPYRTVSFQVENRRIYRVDPDQRLKASDRDWSLKEINRIPPPLMYEAMDDSVSWLLWRPALPMYLLIGATIFAAIRWRRSDPLVLAVPIAIQTAVMALICPSQEFRYQWPVFLCGWLMTPFLLLWKPAGQPK